MYSFPWKVAYFGDHFFMQWWKPLKTRKALKHGTTVPEVGQLPHLTFWLRRKNKAPVLTLWSCIFVFLRHKWKYDFPIVPVGIWQCLKQANLLFKLSEISFPILFRSTLDVLATLTHVSVLREAAFFPRMSTRNQIIIKYLKCRFFPRLFLFFFLLFLFLFTIRLKQIIISTSDH